MTNASIALCGVKLTRSKWMIRLKCKECSPAATSVATPLPLQQQQCKLSATNIAHSASRQSSGPWRAAHLHVHLVLLLSRAHFCKMKQMAAWQGQEYVGHYIMKQAASSACIPAPPAKLSFTVVLESIVVNGFVQVSLTHAHTRYFQGSFQVQ